MTQFPVRPSEALALVVQPEDSLAVAILKTFVKLPPLMYKVVKYFVASNGNIGEKFCADLRTIQCPDPTEDA